jgi:hypothetical protein
VSGSLSLLLAILVPGVLSFIIAFVLLRARYPRLGLIAGIMVILVAQVYLQWRIQAGVRACLERSCGLVDYPVACDAAAFGCTEWSGLASVAFLIAGALDILLLLAAYAVAFVVVRRQARRQVTG